MAFVRRLLSTCSAILVLLAGAKRTELDAAGVGDPMRHSSEGVKGDHGNEDNIKEVQPQPILPLDEIKEDYDKTVEEHKEEDEEEVEKKAGRKTRAGKKKDRVKTSEKTEKAEISKDIMLLWEKAEATREQNDKIEAQLQEMLQKEPELRSKVEKKVRFADEEEVKEDDVDRELEETTEKQIELNEKERKDMLLAQHQRDAGNALKPLHPDEERWIKLNMKKTQLGRLPPSQSQLMNTLANARALQAEAKRRREQKVLAAQRPKRWADMED